MRACIYCQSKLAVSLGGSICLMACARFACADYVGHIAPLRSANQRKFWSNRLARKKYGIYYLYGSSTALLLIASEARKNESSWGIKHTRTAVAGSV